MGRADGEPRATLAGSGDQVHGLAFPPDGGQVAGAVSEGGQVVWDVKASGAARTFQGHAGAAYAVAFSPDGRALASAGKDGSARLWCLK